MKYQGLFSQRNKFVEVSDTIIYGKITEEINIAIINCFDRMWESLNNLHDHYSVPYELHRYDVEREIWIHFCNKKLSEFVKDGRFYLISVNYLERKEVEWFNKLDLIEFVLGYIKQYIDRHFFNAVKTTQIMASFIENLNFEFDRLNFGYRIINNCVTEITSKEEIESIQEAVDLLDTKIQKHLQKALEHYSRKPDPDIRNSIKESISAVECICREITGENCLGAALKALEKRGIPIHHMLKDSFTKLYAYTNNPDTGIRHALMDSDSTYTPTKAEAHFMLVSCCCFINYIREKVSTKD